MKITSDHNNYVFGTIRSSILGNKAFIKISKMPLGIMCIQKYKIPDDLETLKLVDKETKKSLGDILIITLLMLVLAVFLGFIFPILIIFCFVAWIVLLLNNKNIRATCRAKFKDGNSIGIKTNHFEWKILSKYITD